MIFITTTKRSDLEFILAEMSWELLLESKNVKETTRHIVMKMAATIMANEAWTIWTPVQHC